MQEVAGFLNGERNYMNLKGVAYSYPTVSLSKAYAVSQSCAPGEAHAERALQIALPMSKDAIHRTSYITPFTLHLHWQVR